ncbi:Phosphate ABC superfamily ATP binding cassette transporter, permease protein [Alteracholeplasma palmae J233]|uniref:Phosphate transport system permease protein n=1 Tax=Alteracholeplasma palmae (strain ATCC 49389 / J233) TaxID=1318466 RepID=U4KNI2_ALTPJ|nr:phosphate ABC transporter permease subunit PstC [Alteracholeplasma palmae]CCV63745.1 Phosphate ABC superfamily ATP binding cassette transporter, permease protein [Alteracholeplasma palmae J233]
MQEERLALFKKKKKITDIVVRSILLLATIISASIVILIVIQIASRGLRPFFAFYDFDGPTGLIKVKLNFFEFISGTQYIQPVYQIGFIIINTIFTVAIAVLLAIPIAVLTSLYIAKIAPKWASVLLTTVVEMLAAVPSIIYGMFGSGFIAKGVQSFARLFGREIGLNSLLTTILVLMIMVLPTITMMSTLAIKSVSKETEQGSLALGVTPTKTYFKVTIKAAKSGIFAGIILAIGRALGEATAVSLVSGNTGKGPNFDLFGPTRTLTSTILSGLKETSGFDYDVRFSIGLVLIVIILVSNIALNSVKKRMSRYEK